MNETEDQLKSKLFDAEETIGKLNWYRTAYSDYKIIVRSLLDKLEQDYNHKWPNEDFETKIHRLKMLELIKSTYLK